MFIKNQKSSQYLNEDDETNMEYWIFRGNLLETQIKEFSKYINLLIKISKNRDQRLIEELDIMRLNFDP